MDFTNILISKYGEDVCIKSMFMPPGIQCKGYEFLISFSHPEGLTIIIFTKCA